MSTCAHSRRVGHSTVMQAFFTPSSRDWREAERRRGFSEGGCRGAKALAESRASHRCLAATTPNESERGSMLNRVMLTYRGLRHHPTRRRRRRRRPAGDHDPAAARPALHRPEAAGGCAGAAGCTERRVRGRERPLPAEAAPQVCLPMIPCPPPFTPTFCAVPVAFLATQTSMFAHCFASVCKPCARHNAA
jgi:hypothetical protein